MLIFSKKKIKLLLENELLKYVEKPYVNKITLYNITIP